MDIRVSWLALDTNAEPCDIRVSWLALDTNAVLSHVQVSWLSLYIDAALNSNLSDVLVIMRRRHRR